VVQVPCWERSPVVKVPLSQLTASWVADAFMHTEQLRVAVAPSAAVFMQRFDDRQSMLVVQADT